VVSAISFRWLGDSAVRLSEGAKFFPIFSLVITLKNQYVPAIKNESGAPLLGLALNLYTNVIFENRSLK